MPDRSRFACWTEIATRYGDTDRQGHVNNAVFATLCEAGRVTLLHCSPDPIAPPGFSFVVARLAIDFRAELHWPGMVEIGTVVTSLGRSSVRMAQVLYQNGVRAAESESVLVLTDQATRRPAPLDEPTRSRLARFMRPATAEAEP